MKCDEVRTFFSQIAGKSVSTQIQQADLDFFSTNGYISVMQKEEYERALAEVSGLEQLSVQLQKETAEEREAEAALQKDESRTHSILFHLEGREEKEAAIEKVESEKTTVSREEADVVEVESKLNELIQKKSAVDRAVEYDGRYLSLTGLGVVALSDLNVRNYRVSDSEFSDFIEESRQTSDELKAIADRGAFYVPRLKADFQREDVENDSQFWSVSIGLAKLQGDTEQISQRFLAALGVLQRSESTIENKMMAAEIMTASNSDLQGLSESFASLDDHLRHDAHVPEQLSAGVAATMMSGKRYDGTYPTDRFGEFSRVTASYESAAILAINNVPSDQLTAKFRSFRSMFESWGYEASEDTELASAYLSVSELGPDDVKTKMTIILDALKNYLEYPLVAGAILVSIPTLEANETLELTEKAYPLIWRVAPDLQRSELLSLSVLMIHGIRNELVKELDPTAKIAKTPVQMTYTQSHGVFFYPLFIAHSSYYSRFGGVGGAHPAHVHGVGGFQG